MIRKWIKKIVNEILKEELVYEYDGRIEEATAEIVAKRVNIDMDEVYDYLGVSIEDIAHEIDMDDLASSMDAEEVGRGVDLQDLSIHVMRSQEFYDELAEKMDEDDLADCLDYDKLAEKVDEDDLADCLDYDKLAEKVDTHMTVEMLAKSIDYKLMAKAVVEHQKKEGEE